MRRAGCALLVSVLLTGCASTDLGFGGARPPEGLATETFAYGDASDRNVRIVVEQVVMAGQEGFIPSDPNWLQIQMTVTNRGSRTIDLTRIQEQVEGGVVFPAAQGASELMKPPNLVRETLVNTGIGAAGMAAGYLLFPPAALLGGAVILFRPMFEGDRVGRMAERLNRESLRIGPIAPGTAARGWVFVPAVRGQTGLILVYDVNGSAESVTIARR